VQDAGLFIVCADEKLTVFLEPQFGKIVLTLSVVSWHSHVRAKSVGRLPQELHLTLFPQS